MTNRLESRRIISFVIILSLCLSLIAFSKILSANAETRNLTPVNEGTVFTEDNTGVTYSFSGIQLLKDESDKINHHFVAVLDSYETMPYFSMTFIYPSEPLFSSNNDVNNGFIMCQNKYQHPSWHVYISPENITYSSSQISITIAENDSVKLTSYLKKNETFYFVLNGFTATSESETYRLGSSDIIIEFVYKGETGEQNKELDPKQYDNYIDEHKNSYWTEELSNGSIALMYMDESGWYYHDQKTGVCQTSNNGLLYFNNGINDKSFTGSITQDRQVYTVKQGKAELVKFDVPIPKSPNDTQYYFEVRDFDRKVAYVNKGTKTIVDSFEGLLPYNNRLMYFNNGLADFNKTGIVYGKYFDYYYVDKGFVDLKKNSIEYFDKTRKWYKVTNGAVDLKANGIFNNKLGWWKTTGGVVTFKENGVFQNEFGWWRVKDSKVDFNAQGIYQNSFGWWKTTNGKVTFKENGVFQNEFGWWKVKDSKVDFSFTGIAGNKYGNWYIKGGKVDFNKNGKVNYNGKTYTIKNGKVV